VQELWKEAVALGDGEERTFVIHTDQTGLLLGHGRCRQAVGMVVVVDGRAEKFELGEARFVCA
jgi:hypothetical protein